MGLDERGQQIAGLANPPEVGAGIENSHIDRGDSLGNLLKRKVTEGVLKFLEKYGVRHPHQPPTPNPNP
ncbi:MAG TPA: hypothetical protein VF189_04270, partial [Patescibacteria group bacterium]